MARGVDHHTGLQFRILPLSALVQLVTSNLFLGVACLWAKVGTLFCLYSTAAVTWLAVSVKLGVLYVHGGTRPRHERVRRYPRVS